MRDGQYYEAGDATIQDDSYYSINPCVVLPHSCDKWKIGGRKEVDQMIADLTNLLDQLP